MSRVVIVEDSEVEAKKRYGRLTSKHDVTLLFVGDEPTLTRIVLKDTFDLEKVHIYPTATDLVQNLGTYEGADIYFVDGLKGEFPQVFQALTGNEVHLVSGSRSCREEANSRGYKVTNESEVERLLGELN